MKPRVAALILAAGASSRMGKPKQLLDLGGKTMLEHVLSPVLRMDFAEIATVIGHQAESIQSRLCIRDSRFRWVLNPHYAKGQSTSLRAGIEALADHCQGVMVFLGDTPWIEQKTMQAVFDKGGELLAFTEGPFVVQPVLQGMPGHPVFFGRVPMKLFSQLQGDRGAKPLIRQIKDHYLLPVADEGVLQDVDTPEDVVRLLKK
ncbi:NTP transferase domain-containing protein [Ammoniphilus sp. YIM 78166]|uniref:nucleotidyltransferase family protein n=1 Tax=Ammoniphilus sp. YIM 78166 TaxID=1644106 RepID=UPI001070285B|nr:nucleotidyltransferase family protein [Ammoniphilus sp. YIM 78166]